MKKNEPKYYDPQLVGQSEEVKTANQQMQNMEMPSNDYVKQYYQSAIDKMNQPFSYDYANDPSYKALYQVAVNNGQKAMKDTIGKATALTGGYMNSYAQTAGQGAYNDYMTRLNEQIPTLENAAYQRYRQGISDAIQQADLAKLMYGMDTDAYDREYSRLADQRDFAYKTDASNTDILNRAAEYNLGLDNKPYEDAMNLQYQTDLEKMQADVAVDKYRRTEAIDQQNASANEQNELGRVTSLADSLVKQGIITPEERNTYILQSLAGKSYTGATQTNPSFYEPGSTDYNRAVKVATDDADSKHYDSAADTLGGYVDKTMSAKNAGNEYSKILVEAVANGDMTSAQAMDKFDEWVEKYCQQSDWDTLKAIGNSMENEITINKGSKDKEKAKSELLRPFATNSLADKNLAAQHYYALYAMGEYDGTLDEFWSDLKNDRIRLTRDGTLTKRYTTTETETTDEEGKTKKTTTKKTNW